MSKNEHGVSVESTEDTRRYFITYNGQEREVTKAEYVRAERNAGFRSKFGPDEPATASWGSSSSNEKGRIEYGS